VENHEVKFMSVGIECWYRTSSIGIVPVWVSESSHSLKE